MPGFLKTRKNTKTEIDSSHSSLSKINADLLKLYGAIKWMLHDKSQLERAAATIDQLNSEGDEEKLGEIENNIERTMTLLNDNFKCISNKMAVFPETKTMTDELGKKLWDARDQFDEIACDIVEYKFNKCGKVDVKKRFKPRGHDMKNYEFATSTIETKQTKPLKIEVSTSSVRNEFVHRIVRISEGGEPLYIGKFDNELIAINGRYVKELNEDEIKLVFKKQIETGTVILEILQSKIESNHKITAGKSLTFQPIWKPVAKRDSTVSEPSLIEASYKTPSSVGFLNEHGNLSQQIESSQNILSELDTDLENFKKALSDLLRLKTLLERNARRIELLMGEKSMNNDEKKLAKIEANLKCAMITLNTKLNEVTAQLTASPNLKELKKQIEPIFTDLKKMFGEITCDIYDLKFERYGPVDAQQCFKPLSYEAKELSFSTTILESTNNTPLNIELRSKEEEGKCIHYIEKISEGVEIIYAPDLCEVQLLTINGRFLNDLNEDEVEPILQKELATGKVKLEIVQSSYSMSKTITNGNAITFKLIQDNVSEKGRSLPPTFDTPNFTFAAADCGPIVGVIESQSGTTHESEDGEPEAKRVKLTADPPTCTVAAAGGVFTHQLTNSGTEKIVFKVKSSNNNEYRIKPVYGFVEPGASTALQVARTAGVPKEDKLVIHFGPVAADAVDATAAFEEIKGKLNGSVTIPLFAN